MIVRCSTCGRQQTVRDQAEREAWIKYHNAIWPEHEFEDENE